MELDWLQLIVLVPAVLAAIWAVVTFTLEWRRKQGDERKRRSTLYINPFLLACEELQSRFWNMLSDGDEQRSWHQDTGDTSQAEETLYLIAQYFGWERHIFRYGPYAQDGEVFQRTEAIRAAFATNRAGIPEGRRRGRVPFCFYRYQQKALAQIILHINQGPAGWQAETIPYVAFMKRRDQLADLLPPVQTTLEALRSGDFPVDLDPLVRGRLAEVQNHLVELLDYLERKEQFTLFAGQRQKRQRHPAWIEWSERKGWSCLLDDGAT